MRPSMSGPEKRRPEPAPTGDTPFARFFAQQKGKILIKKK